MRRLWAMYRSRPISWAVGLVVVVAVGTSLLATCGGDASGPSGAGPAGTGRDGDSGDGGLSDAVGLPFGDAAEVPGGFPANSVGGSFGTGGSGGSNRGRGGRGGRGRGGAGGFGGVGGTGVGGTTGAGICRSNSECPTGQVCYSGTTICSAQAGGRCVARASGPCSGCGCIFAPECTTIPGATCLANDASGACWLCATSQTMPGN